MDRLPRPWVVDVTGGPAPAAAAPGPVDLWLVEVAYEVMVNRGYCGRCGAALGRDLHLAGTADAWPVTVRTRCRGWRRHRYLAEAGPVAADLRLGPFVLQSHSTRPLSRW